MGGILQTSKSHQMLWEDQSDRILLERTRLMGRKARAGQPALLRASSSPAGSPAVQDAVGLAGEAGSASSIVGSVAGGEGAAPAAAAADDSVPALFAHTAALVADGAEKTVHDSFSKCFKSREPEPWNWNLYLFLGWVVGQVILLSFLVPLRILIFAGGWGFFFTMFAVIETLRLLGLGKATANACKRWLTQVTCSSIVASWSGVIKFHGVRPTAKKGELPGVFVANHSSMIDFVVLQQGHSYSVVGQKHKGWVAFVQDVVLGCVDPIWFDRSEAKDKAKVRQRLIDHANNPDAVPLLVFPEGTCVNNEYVIQFRKTVFELGVPINPVAIKYNKLFTDAYWNSRAVGFGGHLLHLMTSWAVVADVWFLEPMTINPGESSIQFAKRVQQAIAAQAGIRAVDWDGYMKYWKPSERFMRARRLDVAEDLMGAHGIPFSRASGKAPAPRPIPAAAAAAAADGDQQPRRRGNKQS